MKWYILVLALYSSSWGFLGWGIHGKIIELITTLSLFLTCLLIVIFNFKIKLLKEALMTLCAPCMTAFIIIKSYQHLNVWKIILLIIAILLQAFLLLMYYKFKKKKALQE